MDLWSPGGVHQESVGEGKVLPDKHILECHFSQT